ncbi:MAG TPA: PIN domain-containing protein [Verrucomicrobiae bacterium]|nr:PIN domain-containing protein [Verrucomicrobiae bacterium]
MTGIADTRLMLTLEFPPTKNTSEKIEEFVKREIAKQLIAPSIVLTEFVKYAGTRIGEDAAKNRLRLLEEKGLRILPITEKIALTAGSLLLINRNAPIADALIASFVKDGVAEYVVTDDPHFKAFGIKTKWI